MCNFDDWEFVYVSALRAYCSAPLNALSCPEGGWMLLSRSCGEKCGEDEEEVGMLVGEVWGSSSHNAEGSDLGFVN